MTHKGWSDTPKSFTVIYQGCYSPSELTIMSIIAGSHNGVKGVYVRGGLTYNISSTLKPELKLSEYTSGDEVYASGTASYTTYTNATAIWTNDGTAKFSSSLPIYAPNVYGAVWNDYAEYRDQKEEIKPGYCAAAVNDGRLIKTSYRLQPCDGIVSDTFGFAIGETDNCRTPLAVSGRVLAYFEGNREDYQAGDVVGAGPNGKIIKMTREEIKEYPDRIIGHVSEIPKYETWGTGNIKVDNRIWIKVK
jgi:hypothetical protein